MATFATVSKGHAYLIAALSHEVPAPLGTHKHSFSAIENHGSESGLCFPAGVTVHLSALKVTCLFFVQLGFIYVVPL